MTSTNERTHGSGCRWRRSDPAASAFLKPSLVFVLIVLATLGAFAGSGAPLHAAELTGSARVIDGDTIEVQGKRIRLFGIDAPESRQQCVRAAKRYACGKIAAAALKDLTTGIAVRCREEGMDRYGRIVATCFDDNGFDINRNMVYTGWALAYRKYSTRYVATEKKARAAGRGLWKGAFVAPWEWRRGERLASSRSSDETPSACRIKGNISKSGARIYHLPGDRFYARTRIDESKGERWFCSEAEARAAGWRRARR